MKFRPIKTEEDYQNALLKLEQLFDAKINTKKGENLEILSLLIEQFENKNFTLK